MLQEVVVTATKKSQAEDLQKVPSSVSVVSSGQLAVLQVRDLHSLSSLLPNVQFNTIGSVKSVANFAIRGLGVEASVPSIEPEVGTFIDGVYLGTNYGVNMDMFGIDSVQVLRGPQGVLFGRNVSGGAVVIDTQRPTGQFHVDARVNVETDNQIYAGSVQGTIVPDKVYAEVVGYYDHDDGYFPDPTLGRHVGKSDTWFVRPTVVFQPTDNIKSTLIFETGAINGDGPVAGNPKYATGFVSTEDYAGLTQLEHNSLTWETDIDLGQSGKIVNIAGYRDLSVRGAFDLDGSAQSVVTQADAVKQNQFSDELRYSNRLWGRTDLVAGLYYFHQNMLFEVEDDLLFSHTDTGFFGGQQITNSYGIFVNTDTSITDKLTLGLGLRYSFDQKHADIATEHISACSFVTLTCAFDFHADRSFPSVSPRVSLKYQFTPRIQAYALYTEGHRAGGFDIQSASTTADLTANYGDQTDDDFEIGLKSEFFDRRLIVNVGGFYELIRGLQLEDAVQLPTGSVTTFGNAANAQLDGGEAEVTAELTHSLVFRGSLGLVHGHYTKVFQDLNNAPGGVVQPGDIDMKLPQLAPVAYNVGLFYDGTVGSLGRDSAEITYGYTDSFEFNVANTGIIPAFGDLSGSVSFVPASAPNLKITAYGKNLLNNYTTGNNTPLGSFPSGGFIQFPVKGRVLGVELAYHY
jgi:outer membrane receptor protein involved in Fe transport